MIIINSDKYGQKTRFSGLEAATNAIRKCGADFAATHLTMDNGRIKDETGEYVGHITHQCEIIDDMGELPTRRTRHYNTWAEAHAAAEKLLQRHDSGSRYSIIDVTP